VSARRPTILIAGQLGSGCTEVAKLVSRQLGLEVQNTEGLLRELVAQFRESFEELSEDIRSGEVDIDSVLLSMSRDVVSKGGIVLEGRSALLVLDIPSDLKVFLFRDREERIEFLAGRRGISRDEAAREVDKSDRERQEKVAELFKTSWTDLRLYDLVINTSKTGFELAASLILEAVKSRRNA
jgi:cytidylate kinase